MRSNDAVREAIVALLGVTAVGRSDIVEHVQRLGVSGPPSDVRTRVDKILQRDNSFAEVAAGVVYVPALVEGTSWPLFVDPDDAVEGFLRIDVHLAGVGWWLVDGGVPLVDVTGDVLGELYTDAMMLDGTDTDVVFGPEGWLDDVAGGWATVTVRSGGLTVLPTADLPMATARQVAAMTLGFERAARSIDAELFDGEHVVLEFATSERCVLEALVADREAFAGERMPAVPELLAAAGLGERRGLVAADGFDWDSLRSWQQRNEARLLYGLAERQIDALTMLVGACSLHAEVGAEALGPDEAQQDGGAIILSVSLEDGAVAEAFWEEARRRGQSVETVAEFADELTARTGDVALPGLAWLVARCREQLGDSRDAMELLEGVVDDECRHRPALLTLAGFASDRGDAMTAWRLIRQAGIVAADGEPVDVDDDDAAFVEEVALFATARPRPTVGRNDPCPCGSGRKYKACHLGREPLPLSDRAPWLYAKAARYLRRIAPEVVDDVTSSMSDGPLDLDGIEHSSFVADVALHEHGLFDEFLEDRGWMLPADEALLAAQWALTDRGVFEITGIGRDFVDLRDIGRGENIRVVNTTPEDVARVGMIVVGRPLPVGDTYRAISPVLPLPLRLVDPMLDAISDGDADAVVGLLASIFRRPGLQNTDGEQLVVHLMRWSIRALADPHTEVADGLTAAGMMSDDGRSWRLVADTANQRDTVLFEVRLDLESLTLVSEANSDERAERLSAIIAEAVPGAEILDDHRRELSDILDEHRTVQGAPAPVADAEVDRLLDEMMRVKEREWIDLSIPALDGRTPREAVTDPIGREQLERLLASFPEPPPGPANSMRPSRLRQLLQLEGR